MTKTLKRVAWGVALFPWTVAVATVVAVLSNCSTPPVAAATARPDTYRIFVAGDSIRIRLYYHVSGTLASVDSVGSSLEVPAGTVFSRQPAHPPLTLDSVTYALARPALTISGRACVGPLYLKGGATVAGQCIAWTYAPPGVTVDSVNVSLVLRVLAVPGDSLIGVASVPNPALATTAYSFTFAKQMQPGEKNQWCLHYRFKNGWRLLARNNDVPACRVDLAKAG